MKFSRKSCLGLAAIVLGVFTLRADLTKWAENIDVRSRLEAVFFRSAVLPGGQIPVRRPPKETRPELTRLIDASPNDAELYTLRALEAEQQLDFSAAENDWKKYIDVAPSDAKGAARVALADYYHRRHQPQQEFEALTFAAREFAPPSERLLPETEQRPWKTYERMFRLIDEQRLDPALGISQCGAWIQRFPQQPAAYQSCFRYLLTHDLPSDAEDVIAAHERVFASDTVFPVAARAESAAKRGATADALALYERSYQPLWPDTLLKNYFELLRQTGRLRAYLETARNAIATNPTDLVPATRVFHYWQQQGNTAAAQRALVEFRQRKQTRQSPWTANELLTLAKLSEAARDYDEAARNYYALYGLDTSEAALASLARLLLTAPDQPIHFGSSNLSFYRDVATMDPHPGFLNGVLSLLLNETDPPYRHDTQERNAAPYFRRAQAAELVTLFESRFPNSPQRAELREMLIEAYAVYGDNDAVIRTGTRFLTDFPNAPNRTAVALRIADAYARTNQTPQEFVQYDAVLAELARRADGVPLGTMDSKGKEGAPNATPNANPSVRSPEYARVLARYVARLVSLQRVQDALTLYRREIDRNPNDPGLYDLLASFLEQNRFGAETEQVYQRAIAQFQEPTWRHKLARWYLRQRRQADIDRLSREVVGIFSGTDLASYFNEVVSQAAPVGPALYLQLNLAAHERFPHQLTFARNLLTAYTTRGTADDAAYEAILRQNWYHADDLRMRFFERLSRTGRLAAELNQVRAANAAANTNRWSDAADQSPATVRLLSEGELWRGHYELAAPMLQALEAIYPADPSLGRRTASVFRSLGAADAAIGVETKLTQADPLDHDALTRIGEIEADRGRFDQARAAWDKIPAIEPSKPDGYLETATVFWDYYRFDDALRSIDLARTRLNQPALHAYQAGAVHENRRDYDRAMREYARGALESLDDSPSRARLLTLARRPALTQPIDQLTDNLTSARNPQINAVNLRVALLKSQNRRDDLERFLQNIVARADASEALLFTENTARIEGFPRVEQSALERRIALTSDPVEKMSLRLALARFDESQARIADGGQVIDALHRENPAILGVVRAAVDYHWRNKNTRRSIDILEDAATRAEPTYRSQFTLEAARKATESGDTTRARTFANTLLAADPFRAEYVSAMAATYARDNNDAGLSTFYTSKIAALATAPLPAADRIERTAAMRRALIPILARTRDFTAAVDQYIEILNRYPEDEALAREAAQFARANNLAPRLRDFYSKASNDSPKDHRWPLVLARIETQFEDYPAAIAAFTRSAGVRPDRADILQARLNLEERLLRFDDAAATTEKLYELTYRNPQWMDKLTELRARQGRAAEAVAALNKAWIEGRSGNPENYFTAAAKLESWNMLAEARTMTDLGLRQVPAGQASNQGEALFARLAMRTRNSDVALARLLSVPATASSSVAAQIGAVVAQYYTPDEKTIFAAKLAVNPRRIELARAAGLADVEAQALNAIMATAPNSDRARQTKEQLIRLQTQRARFAELGQQLEAYDLALPPGATRSNELEEAASAYRAAGNTAAETRVLERLNRRAALSGETFDRYASLLLAQPARLNTVLAQETRADSAYALLNYALEHATPAVAQQAVAARAPREGVLWTRAYTSLTGLYNSSNAATIRTAFTGLLGDMTIGARVGKPIDRTTQLAGDLWFYYGGRFGEYLAATQQPGSDDYLPAMVEDTPARSEAYFQYADLLADPATAAENYRYALELNPTRADVHDRLAVLAAKSGGTDEALAEWRLTFQAFTAQMNAPRLPGSFWADVPATLTHIADANQAAALRDDADRLLRLYIRRNGSFQAEPLLEAAMKFAGIPASGAAYIADLSNDAADPVQFLRPLLERDWIPDAQKSTLYQRLADAARQHAAQVFGDAHREAEQRAWTIQIEYAEFLVNRRDNAQARQALDQLPAEAKSDHSSQIVQLEIRLAARSGQLPAYLARYVFEPRPSGSGYPDLTNAASDLRKDGDLPNSRRVNEFIYQRLLADGNTDISTFIGLAEIRLAENDVPAALTLLRRMTLLVNSWDQAAQLLETTNHSAEAVEFLTSLTKSEPWNLDAKRRLAEAQRAPDQLAEVARSNAAPYATRLAAAESLRKLNAPPLTNVDSELALLSSQTNLAIAPIANSYAYESRIASANALGVTPAQREQRLQAAVAIRPEDQAVKLALFNAALAARHDTLALAIARQLLPPYFRPESERRFSPYLADEFLANLPDASRIAVARGMADANQRLGNPPDAAFYYRITQALAPAQTVPLAALRAQLDLGDRNAPRRPLISKNLDQDHPVRPRLTQ